jgi:hypothetical protein
VPLFVVDVDRVPVLDTLIVLEFDGLTVFVTLVVDDLERMPELLDDTDGRAVILIAEVRLAVVLRRLVIDAKVDEVPVRDVLTLLD